MKTVLVCVGTIIVLQALKWTLGTGVALTVAVGALGFCMGVFWGAGDVMRRYGIKNERKDPPSRSLTGSFASYFR